MHLRLPAIVCAARPHAETAVIVRIFTADHGMIAGYVAGGRGRQLRPVLIPGNRVEAEINARSESQLPYLRLELVESRGPWLTEPLASAVIAWATTLSASTLPERQAFAPLHAALTALLDAVCFAPSARGWVPALLSFEELLLRELGYGAAFVQPVDDDWPTLLAAFDTLGRALTRNPLADRTLAVVGRDVMATRSILRDRLARIAG